MMIDKTRKYRIRNEHIIDNLGIVPMKRIARNGFATYICG